MVYGIVKQAGGYVWVDSEVGRGTTFQIYLPRIDEPVGALGGRRRRRCPREGGRRSCSSRTKAPCGRIAREILEEHGYRVIEAADGTKTRSRSPAAIRSPSTCCVTDVVMPRMNGRALAETLVAARPEIKVLYMSGYTDDVIAHSGVLEPGTLLLEKPFTALALLGRVRAALGEAVLEADA